MTFSKIKRTIIWLSLILLNKIDDNLKKQNHNQESKENENNISPVKIKRSFSNENEEKEEEDEDEDECDMEQLRIANIKRQQEDDPFSDIIKLK